MNGCKHGPFRLWYIEDDENDQALMKRAVKATRRACALTCFSDPHDAIHTLESMRKPSVEGPHLIITDLKMHAMNGIEFLKWLRRSRFACLPVMLLTGSALCPDLLSAYRYGANAFSTKPVDYASLQTCVQNIFNFWLDVCALHEHSPLLAAPEEISPGAWAASEI